MLDESFRVGIRELSGLHQLRDYAAARRCNATTDVTVHHRDLVLFLFLLLLLRVLTLFAALVLVRLVTRFFSRCG